MSLFLDTRGLSTVAVGICDRCKMKVPLAKMRDDGNSPGLRVCDKPGCWDHFDPYRLPARRTEDITLRYPRPEVALVPEPPINIFQHIVAASDAVAFSDSADSEVYENFAVASDSVTFSDSSAASDAGSLWDATQAGSAVVLSEGGQLAEISGAYNSVLGFARLIPDGVTLYFEVEIVDAADGRVLVGAAAAGVNLENYPGSDFLAVAYYGFNGGVYTGGPTGTPNATYTSGDRIGVALVGSGAVTSVVWYKNGAAQPGGWTLPPLGPFYPIWGTGIDTGGPRGGRVYTTGVAFLPPGALEWS